LKVFCMCHLHKEERDFQFYFKWRRNGDISNENDRLHLFRH
jgi:hypothetical protein